MRTRIRTGPVCTAYSNQHEGYLTNWAADAGSGVLTTHPNYPLWTTPLSYKRWEEYMEDDTGTGGVFRPCFHTTSTNEFYSPWVRAYTDGLYNFNWLQQIIQTQHVGLVRSTATTFPVWDLDKLASEALGSMIPKLNRGISLLNFLLELKELKGIYKHGWSLSGALSRIRGHAPQKRVWGNRRFKRTVADASKASYSDIKYRLKGGRRELSKDILRRLSNAHLETSFGWVPLIKDVAQIWSSLYNMDQVLSKLKERAGTPQQRHREVFLPVNVSQPVDNGWTRVDMSSLASAWPTYMRSYLGGGAPSGSAKQTVVLTGWYRYIQRPVYHATVRYIYTLPDLDSKLNKVRAYLDVLGVRADPSILWNAIPFSFLIDWVVDVGGWLESFAQDNLSIQTQVMDFCHSVKYHAEYRLWVKWPTGAGSYFPAPYWSPTTTVSPPFYKEANEMVWEGTNTYYKRTYANLRNTRSFTLRTPKGRQGALAGSLIIQKVFGAKKKK